MSREPVKVLFTKYDGATHWHFDAVRLGADDAGTWLGLPAGTLARRGSEPAIIWRSAGVVLVPHEQWWIATFNAEPHKYEIYIDISTPPTWITDHGTTTVSMVDLDLDVARMRDGEVRVLDEDEFAEHRVKYDYPPDVVASARSATDRLAAAVADDTEPFASAYRQWLALVT